MYPAAAAAAARPWRQALSITAVILIMGCILTVLDEVEIFQGSSCEYFIVVNVT